MTAKTKSVGAKTRAPRSRKSKADGAHQVPFAAPANALADPAETAASADAPLSGDEGGGRRNEIANGEVVSADAAKPAVDPAEVAGPGAETTPAAPAGHSRPKPSSKLGIVLDLLEAPEGATLGKLVEVTGWLPHTTRAALTGLRKRGFAVASTKAADGRGSVYRIAQDAA